MIIKYHSEPHHDLKYQTETEPFHMHVKVNELDLAASKRLPQPKQLRAIDDILINIVNGKHLNYVFIKE
ncbi:toxin-antitoxin system TumE family protein [Gottfriedia acidiceleris]|uniref:toxin-antitoxin system TumE family protein n=1 Tax=Gottfriedia acidiceleris TaxID=371036 RepID=UPI0022870649|nr:DUF6516 family protein [Gottfriedia acidiceleris]